MSLLKFKLRGLCPDSNVDERYITLTQKPFLLHCKFKFDGYSRTNILYSEMNQRWEMKDLTTVNQTVLGYYNGSARYPLGKSLWVMSHKCSGHQIVHKQIILKLSQVLISII
jgi:hypothetical protein